MNNSEKHDLEDMIDKYGLAGVLSETESICYKKAEHIVSSYDDQDTAERWGEAGAEICKVYNEVVNMFD